jgi:hypothetical protein
MTIRSMFQLPLAIAGTLLVAAATVGLSGQGSTDTTGTAQGFLILVPVRDLTDVEAAVAVAQDDVERARRTEHQVANLRIDTRADIERINQAIGAIKRRRTAARDSASPEFQTLDSEGKALEREKNLLEERERLGSVEVDLARRSAELAGLSKRALELERELLLKRTGGDIPGAEGPVASSRNRVILDLEEQTLRAQVAHADKKIEVATLEKQIIDRLLKILSARRRVVVS